MVQIFHPYQLPELQSCNCKQGLFSKSPTLHTDLFVISALFMEGCTQQEYESIMK